MKKVILLSILVFSFVIAKSQSPQPSITFETVEQMMAYRGSYTQAFVTDTLRGGTFQKLEAGTEPLAISVTADSGVVFPAYYAGYFWVRQFQISQGFNITWWGALGNGVSSITEDTTALRGAIRYLGNISYGRRLYIPNSPAFYAFAGTPILVPDNLEVFGDGKYLSQIRNVSPKSSDVAPGAIFVGGTYRSDSSNSFMQYQVPKYDLDEALRGDTYIVLQSEEDAAGLSVGEIIAYGCILYYKGGRVDHPEFSFWEGNEIMDISNDTVFLKYPLRIDLFNDTGNVPPKLLNINNAGTSPIFEQPNKTAKNFYIHDMSLTQAQIDELEDTAFTARLDGVWQPGEFFGSKFHNLYISSYSGLGGNFFTHCEWINIDIYGEKKLIDFGYASSQCVLRDITFTFQESPASNFATGFIIINSGMHDLEMSDIKASGTFRGSNLITMAAARDIDIHDIKADFPDLAYDIIALNIGEGDTLATSRNVTVNRVQINAAAVGRWLRVDGATEIDTLRNISVTNCQFRGDLLYYLGIHEYYFRTTGVDNRPHRKDIYSTNGSDYEFLSPGAQLSPGVWELIFRRVAGVADPLATGTLTFVDGSGKSDPSIVYDSTAIIDVSEPNAMDLRDIPSGLLVANNNFQSGNFKVNDVAYSRILNNVTTDSLLITGDTTATVYIGNKISGVNNIGRVGGKSTNYIEGMSVASGKLNVQEADTAVSGYEYLVKDPSTGNVEVSEGVILHYFTPANSTDNAQPVGTVSFDNDFIYYRKPNGTWVKVAFVAF